MDVLGTSCEKHQHDMLMPCLSMNADL